MNQSIEGFFECDIHRQTHPENLAATGAVDVDLLLAEFFLCQKR